MVCFGIETEETEQASEMMAKFDRRLNNNPITALFISGFAKPVKDENTFFYVIVADIFKFVNFTTFIVSLVITIVLYILFGMGWYIWVMAIPTGISFIFSYESYFCYVFFYLIKRTFIKKGITQKLIIIKNDELVKRLYKWGNLKS